MHFGDLAAAVQDYSRVVELGEPGFELYLARARAFFGLELYKSAIADFSKLIALNPAFAEAYFERARARLETGETLGAAADCEEALARGLAGAEVLVVRASALLKLGEPERALCAGGKRTSDPEGKGGRAVRSAG